jgi:hypothetical protein
MSEVSSASHSGLHITAVSLTDARLDNTTVTRASFWRIRVRGAWIDDVQIDGQIGDLRINGVEVGPLIEAELDRRHPQRARGVP